MTAENIMSALGGIDEKFISEYREDKRKITHTAAICGIAACLIAVLAVSVFLITKSPKENAVTDMPHDFPPMFGYDGADYVIGALRQPEAFDESKLVYVGTVDTYVSDSEWSKDPARLDFCTNEYGTLGANIYEYGGDVVIYVNGKYLFCKKFDRSRPPKESDTELYTEDGTIRARHKNGEEP